MELILEEVRTMFWTKCVMERISHIEWLLALRKSSISTNLEKLDANISEHEL